MNQDNYVPWAKVAEVRGRPSLAEGRRSKPIASYETFKNMLREGAWSATPQLHTPRSAAWGE